MKIFKENESILREVNQMRSMKKWTAVVVCILVVAMLASCTANETNTPSTDSNTTAKVNFPDGKPITLVVPFSAGGVTDVGFRLLAPYIEKELGTTVNVVNQPGGDGWVYWLKFKDQKPDGYTICAVNDTMNYARLNPAAPHEEGIDDFIPIACQVVDISSIVMRKGETRFSNFKEMIEYAKQNELTVVMSGFGTEDHIVIEKLNLLLGTKLTCVMNSEGSNECVAALMGGHVDLLSNNVGSVNSFVQSGDLVPLVTFNDKRSAFLPDVPTFEELYGTPLNFHSARGLMVPKGTNEDIVKILEDACKAAINNPEHIQKCKDAGLEVIYKNGSEFHDMFIEGENIVKDMLDELGWSK